MKTTHRVRKGKESRKRKENELHKLIKRNGRRSETDGKQEGKKIREGIKKTHTVRKGKESRKRKENEEQKIGGKR